MTTKLLYGEFVFNNGTARFSIGTGNKWHWQLFGENGIKMNSTTTDSVTIVMAKQLLDEAIVRHDPPVS
jgi:hypothetical protein